MHSIDRISFYYDPQRQGYDTTLWRTFYGSPVVSGGALVFNVAAAYHFGDCRRGDFVFGVTVPSAPAAGHFRQWGVYSYSLGAYLLFDITNDVFSVKTSDGLGNTNSTAVTWQSAWSATETEFRVKWEAGRAVFYVGGVEQAVISDDSITGRSMSLYIANTTEDGLKFHYIDASAIQSYILTPSPEDSVWQPVVYMQEDVALTEAVTMSNPPAALSGIVDTSSVTESVTMSNPPAALSALVDSGSVAEDIVISNPPASLSALVDSGAVAEDIVMSTPIPNLSSLFETNTLVESITVSVA